MTHRLRHLILLIAAAAAALAGAPALAAAAESPAPPRHLAPYALDWLSYVAPDDLPPSRMAVCVVDTGLLVTPDTPADSSQGPILERRATDDGSGEPQGSSDRHLHGTRMAMAAVAPANDWGTIGAATWGRVVSVRATVEGETTFRPAAYNDGIRVCIEESQQHPIAAISLSFACACDFTEQEKALLQDAIGRAHDLGVSVVAGAGNTAGAPTGTPARYPGVLAVGAGSDRGGLCSYATFDERVDLLGPACPVDAASALTGEPFFDDSGGSSTATAVAATAIAALRTLRPDATYDQVERWLRDSARSIDGRRVLDAEAAARLGGLAAVVDRARARMPATPPTASPDPPQPAAHPASPATATPAPGAGQRQLTPVVSSRRLPTPRRVAAGWRSGRLIVSAAGRPAGAQLRVSAEYVGELGLTIKRVRRARRAARVSLRLARAPHRVVVRFVSRREFGAADSKPVTLIRRSGHFRSR